MFCFGWRLLTTGEICHVPSARVKIQGFLSAVGCIPKCYVYNKVYHGLWITAKVDRSTFGQLSR